MMTPGMNVEFQKIFQAERAERGMISARAYALGVMIQRRRERLCSLMGGFALVPPVHKEDVTEIVRLNAELTLIMIERGA